MTPRTLATWKEKITKPHIALLYWSRTSCVSFVYAHIIYYMNWRTRGLCQSCTQKCPASDSRSCFINDVYASFTHTLHPSSCTLARSPWFLQSSSAVVPRSLKRYPSMHVRLRYRAFIRHTMVSNLSDPPATTTRVQWKKKDSLGHRAWLNNIIRDCRERSKEILTLLLTTRRTRWNRRRGCC